MTVSSETLTDFLNLKTDYLVSALWAGLKGAIAEKESLTQMVKQLSQHAAALEERISKK